MLILPFGYIIGYMMCNRCNKDRRSVNSDGLCQWCAKSATRHVCVECGTEFYGASRRMVCDDCRARKDEMIECDGCHKPRKRRTIKDGMCNYCRANSTKRTQPKPDDMELVCSECGRTFRARHDSQLCLKCVRRRNGENADRVECRSCHKLRKAILVVDGMCSYCRRVPSMKRTMTERYGGVGFASKELTEKRYRTNEKRYGDAHVSRVPEIKAKVNKAFDERWGGRRGLANPEIAEKTRATNVERYGTENAIDNAEVRRKAVESILERYGVPSAVLIPEVIRRTSFARRESANGTEVARTLSDAGALRAVVESFDHRPTYVEVAGLLGVRNAGTIAKAARLHGLNGMFNTHAKTSGMENEVRDYVRSLGFDGCADTTVLGGRELDIYVPERSVAIEFDGQYWHSDEVLHDPNHQLAKTEQCLSKGIRLFHVFEWEWTIRRGACETMLSSALDSVRHVDADVLSVSEIDGGDSMAFIEEWCPYQVEPFESSVALCDGDSVLALMVVRDDGCEYIQSNVTVDGGVATLHRCVGDDMSIRIDRAKPVIAPDELDGYSVVRTTPPRATLTDGTDVVPWFADQSVCGERMHRVYDCGASYLLKTK